MARQQDYESLLSKLSLHELLQRLDAHTAKAASPLPSVCIWGEGNTVLSVVSDLFELPALESVLMPPGLHLTFHWGGKPACQIIGLDGATDVSLDELTKCMQDKGGLEDESVLTARLTLPEPALQGLSVTARTIPALPEEEDYLDYDMCAVALAATHLLSTRERKLLKSSVHIGRCCLLCQMAQLPPEDQTHIASLLDSALEDDVARWTLPLGAQRAQLWSAWSRMPDATAREISRLNWLRPLLTKELQRQCGIQQELAQQQTSYAEHLAQVAQEITGYQSRLVRRVSMRVLEPLNNELAGKATAFYGTLQQEIEEGIQEENDLLELAQELPYFIVGEWKDFVRRCLHPRLEKESDRFSYTIQEALEETGTTLLQKHLTLAEQELLRSQWPGSDGIGGAVPANISDFWFSPPCGHRLEVEGQVLSKAMILAGGLTILGFSLLPGSLLLFMGVNSIHSSIREGREALVPQARQINYNCLKELDSHLADLTKQCTDSLILMVEEQCTILRERLIGLSESAQREAESIQKRIDNMQAEIETL